jgi:hypothetical protein
MKKIILVFALLFGLVLSAQNYPGKDVQLLEGKTLKVIPLKENLQKYGYRGFFKDEKLQKNYKKGSGYSTDYKALVGKEFKVAAIERYNFGYPPEPRYRLVLENAETGKLYFQYDEKWNSTFKFEVIGGLEFPEGHFCTFIEPIDAKPHEPGGQWYQTKGKLEGISLYGYVGKENSITFHINFNTGEKEFKTEKGKGITLVFDNGQTISRPDDDVIPDSNGSNVLTVKLLVYGDENIKLIKEHTITGVKLGKYQDEIVEGFTIREYIKCILK